MALTIRPKQECRWDLVSLGEVMLRFDPGYGRISTTRHLEVCEGGGEDEGGAFDGKDDGGFQEAGDDLGVGGAQGRGTTDASKPRTCHSSPPARREL